MNSLLVLVLQFLQSIGFAGHHGGAVSIGVSGGMSHRDADPAGPPLDENYAGPAEISNGF
ncbi:MAG: hypothetical protein ABMA64_16615 [Myxococcota bacterium]